MALRKFRIYIKTDTARQAERTANIVYFLEFNRGRQFDLNIYYYCATWQECVWTDATSHIFSLLVAQSAHWRHFSLWACVAPVPFWNVVD